MRAPDPAVPAERVRVRPGPLRGTICVPGDKSLSHRVLILGSLAAGAVDLSGLAPSGDVLSTATCLARLGATVDLERATTGSAANLVGTVAGPLGEPEQVLDCGNSGTAMRLLAGVAAGVEGLSVLTGDRWLRRRPMQRVTEPLQRMGARILGRDGARLPPLAVEGAGLAAITHHSPVASAQVKSCVLLAGLGADGRTTVVSPAPSRDHTERLLRHLGVVVTTDRGEAGEEVVAVRPGRPRARSLAVPGDPSSAAFWLVAAACGDSELTVKDVGVNPRRTGFLGVLEQLGAVVDRRARDPRCGEPVADLTVSGPLEGGARLSGSAVVDALDELVVLALAGACSREGLEVADAAELRVKESDRIATTAEALGQLGITVEPRPDGYHVPGGQRPRSGTVDARGDHRVAMTAAVAGTLAEGPVEIRGMDAAASSYPSFLEDLARLGGRFEVPAEAEGAG